jgi:methylated-DNA-[protein]-cysteine S-methyltransferase
MHISHEPRASKPRRMPTPHFTLFDTPIGRCALLWRERTLVGVLLPEASAALMLARLRRCFPGAVRAAAPATVQRTIDRIDGLLRGAPDDLGDIELDLAALPPFHRRVYAIARGIRPGSTLTYGEIAARLGEPHAARAVGQALGANPFPIIVPCHRVLAAGGRSGGFSASGGTRTKLRLLELEGAALGGAPGLFDAPSVRVRSDQ